MNFKCTLRYLYMYVLSFFTGKFPMVTCNHYEHVHVLKAKNASDDLQTKEIITST